MTPLCRRALELGAVSGRFTPNEIARSLGLEKAAPELRDDLWRDLSRHVSEVIGGSARAAYAWQLTPDARLLVLPDLVSRTQVAQLIEDAPSLHRGDGFGRFLRALLLGRPVSVETSDYARRNQKQVLDEMTRASLLLDAIQFVQTVPCIDGDKLDDIVAETKRHIIDLRVRRDLLVALPRKHFGYEKEREALSAFLRSGAAMDAETMAESLEDTETRPMFLSGTGGVGKSALHARLFGYWLRRRDAPLTVVLDFDRRQLNSGSPLEMFRELLRQLAGAVHEKGLPKAVAAEMSAALSHMRQDMRSLRAQADFNTQLSELATMALGAFQAGWAEPLRDMPVAIAFDSFEALNRRGGRNVDIVLRFEALLRRALPRLRSLFSGREEPLNEAGMLDWFGPPERRLRLTGLSPREGADLLAEEDRRLAAADDRKLFDDADRRAIAGALSGHPLAILMLAQFAHSRPEDLDELLSDLGTADGRFEVEFAQVFLYERILDRIEDPEVRALAHPGLVLRQINTDLIRIVLAGPCLDRTVGGPPGFAEAERLKDALAAEYWLVEPDDRGFDLRHRPDLRRRMLPGLFARPLPGDSPERAARKERLSSRALEVCAAAAQYFRDGPEAGEDGARQRWEALPTELRRAYALYYRAFITHDDASGLNLEDAQIMDAELGEDIEDLPRAWVAHIKVLLGREVTLAEQKTLNPELFEKAEADRYRMESQVGRSGSGAPVEELATEEASGLTAVELERHIMDSFAWGDFERVAELGREYVQTLKPDDGAATKRFHEAVVPGVLATPLGRVLLSVAGLGDRQVFRSFPFELDQTFFKMLEAGAIIEHDSASPSTVGDKLWNNLSDIRSADIYRTSFLSALTDDEKQQSVALPFSPLSLAAATFDYRMEVNQKDRANMRFIGQWDAFISDPKSSLSDLQELGNSADSARFHLQPWTLGPAEPLEIVRLYRGMTPELHDPIIHMLRDAGDAAWALIDAVMIAETSGEKGFRWPEELIGIGKMMDEVAPVYVQTADRFGLLRPLAQVLGQTFEPIQTVVRMYNAITAWYFPAFVPVLDRPLPEVAVS